MHKKLSVPTLNKSRVAVLVLALVVGGVGSQAAGVLNSPSGGYLVCVDSTTKAVTYPAKTTCPKGSKKLILGAQGTTGLSGADGRTLLNGIKDPESTVGTPGDMFINSVTKTLFGPKNLDATWPAGVSMVGPQGSGGSGPAGANGAAGATGSSGIAITQLSSCGADGTSLCKVGVQGPGGGRIFFVDYNDQYAGFNYLEAAPSSCQATKAWSSDTTHSLVAVNGWAARAVGSGRANTTAMLEIGATSYTGDINGAAFYATSCSAGSKSDWFLGSIGEMELMSDNLQGVGGFVDDRYWSSSENDAGRAWLQYFGYGYQGNNIKDDIRYVRPVRAF